MSKVVNSATQAAVAKATIDNLVEQNAKIKAETLTESKRPRLVTAQGEQATAGAFKADAETGNVLAQRPVILNAGVTAKNEMDINPTVRKIADQAGFAGKRVDQVLAPVTSVISSAKSIGRMSETARDARDRRERREIFDARFKGEE